MLKTSGFENELVCKNRELCELDVQWKIKEFFSLSKEKGCCYQSTAFFFAESSWNLQVFPWGLSTRKSSGYISVFLCRKNKIIDSPNSVYFGLGMRHSTGHDDILDSKEYTFSNDSNISGVKAFYKRSDLLTDKFMLQPTSDLTITCSMEQDYEKSVDAWTHQLYLNGLERLSTDMKDLLSRKRSCDTVMEVKNKKFAAHKSVITARSAVFDTMFQHDMKEKNTGVVSIDDLDPDVFEIFLNYIYSGKAENVTSQNAHHIFSAANKYDLKELKSICLDFMLKNITLENFCYIASTADLHDEEQLVFAAQSFFNENLSEILNTRNWELLLQENYRLANKLFKKNASRREIEKLCSLNA